MKIQYMMLFILAFVFSSCTEKQTELTDLSGIDLGFISLGMDISDLDTTLLIPDDRFAEEKNTYHFKTLEIKTDDSGIINYIRWILSEDKPDLNNTTAYETIEDIKTLFGEDYRERWYDKEQYLKEIIYYSDDSTASFVYHGYSGEPVWLILQGN